MASETTSTGASAQAVDAYKTYLYRRRTKTTAEIEQLKPGESFSLKELNDDIAIVQKVINTAEKFGMPATEENNQLNGLLNLKAGLLNKSWYYQKLTKKVKQKENNAFAYQDVLKEKSLPDSYTVTTGIKKNPILAVKTGPVKSEMKLSGAGSKFSQELLMRMGMLSNCNVLIYQTIGVLSRYGAGLDLRCKHCGIERHLEDKLALIETDSIFPEVEEFCKAHRHEPGAATAQVSPAGRMFRDEDE